MSKRAIIIPILVLGVAAVLLFSIKGYWTTWEGGGEQRTDDAYVRADMTPMSTRVSGSLSGEALVDWRLRARYLRREEACSEAG
jgi:membrane fusion protein (multidrug efflux system)